MKKSFVILTCFLSPLFAQTIFTGDRVDGVPVIEKLDLRDLESSKVHRFMFKGVSNALSQSWYIPLMVAKGFQAGPRLGLQASVHGDELNGVRVIQKLFENLDPHKLSGSVIGLLGANPTGMLASSRYWQLTDDGGSTVNLNRIWPGKEKGDAAEVHAYKLWNQIWIQNVDLFIDLHTQTRGTTFPLFVYADYRNPQVKSMAELIPADQIKMDPGEKGSMETTLVEKNIPAITLEVGLPEVFDQDMIPRALEGIQNVMVSRSMIAGKIVKRPQSSRVYVGNDMVSVRAALGGFAETYVKLGSKVSKGQKIAAQFNAFGDVIASYDSPVDGIVLSLGSHPMREPKSLLVRILFQNPDPKCALGC